MIFIFEVIELALLLELRLKVGFSVLLGQAVGDVHFNGGMLLYPRLLG